MHFLNWNQAFTRRENVRYVTRAPAYELKEAPSLCATVNKKIHSERKDDARDQM